MTEARQFTWIPIYRELSQKLLEYRNRQPELVAILGEAEKQGIPTIYLEDMSGPNEWIPLQEIDPFTFFSCFNRGITEDNRRSILEVIKKKLNLKSAVPEDFTGLPIVNLQQSWYFAWKFDREEDDVSALWDFAEDIVQRRPDQVRAERFERALKVKWCARAKLTMGMFWFKPEEYLALDSRNIKFLKAMSLDGKIDTWQEYLKLLQQIQALKPDLSWPELSRQAFDDEPPEGDDISVREPAPQAYWLFQSNPKYYDLEGALRAGALRTWSVNQHRERIHPGDRVVLWQTGKDAGIYALATVTTEPGQHHDAEDRKYWRKEEEPSPDALNVRIQVDRNLVDQPFLVDDFDEDEAFEKFKPGLQGTNLSITKSDFIKLELLVDRQGRRIWLYAPGPKAKYWESYKNEGIMALGWNEVGDLKKFYTRAEIGEELRRINNADKPPKHDSLALWEFANVMKRGDIVIAKQGTTTYVGYGVVAGEYEHHPERPDYHQVRKVDWKPGVSCEEPDGPIVTKTLTDITKYPDYASWLGEMMGFGGVAEAIIPKEGSMAKNMILYGPPGTGKTYRLIHEYMARFTEVPARISVDEFRLTLVKELPWWQAIAVALLDAPNRTAKVPDLLAHPMVRARLQLSNNKSPGAMLWASLQAHTKQDCPNVKYTARQEPAIFWKDEDASWSIDPEKAKEEAPELFVILNNYRAGPGATAEPVRRYELVTFHQSYSYEDFVEGIKPVLGGNESDQVRYEIREGLFMKLVNTAMANREHKYALFIDEINRGNVASIFGELITLIEDDKREGASNTLTVTLPYSQKPFTVPDNLYIIGTMNTADRSVEALDTALRRRFEFVEMKPLVDKVPSREQTQLKAVDLRALFLRMNERIESLLGRDHCIGHSYFMKINSLADLQLAFANKILPLLREYFYGSPAKIGLVLGDKFVLEKKGKTQFAKGSWGDEALDERPVYEFADPKDLSEADFASIYA